MKKHPVLPVGSYVIYYNLWTGFDTKEFQGQFRSLSKDEIQNLVRGDIIYVDIDPLHPNGKVYGRVKATVSKIEPSTDGRELRIHYRGGTRAGFKTTHKGLCASIDRAVDEQALAEVVARLPLSQVLDNRFG